MDDTFQVRVRAAAVAAWWTFLIASVFSALQWFLYLGVMGTRPAWALPFAGPGATWESVRTNWFLGLAFLKGTLWLLVLAALWLTLWAKQLRRQAGS